MDSRERNLTGYKITTPADKPHFTYIDKVTVPEGELPAGAVRIDDLMEALVHDGFIGRWPYQRRVTPDTRFEDVISRIQPGLYVE